MTERQFKGVWIPAEIYLNSELSWTEKILITEIFSFQKSDGCFASNEYLADFLNVSVKTVANALTHLRQLGLVQVDGYGKQRILTVSLSQNRETFTEESRNRETTFPKSGNSIYRIINTEINTDINNTYKASKRNQKGSRIPNEFTVTSEMVAWASERGVRADLAVETEKFKNYWLGVAGAKGVKLDWTATWRNWILNAETWSRNHGKAGQTDRKQSNVERLGEYEAIFDKYK